MHDLGAGWRRIAPADDQAGQVGGGIARMSAFFQRQMADYVEYHRDPRNCMAHVFGIIFLFLAAIVPFTLWPLSIFGVHGTLASVMVLPVLIYWLILDAALGAAIVAAALLLLATAALMVNNLSLWAVWATTAVLAVVGVASQIVGHQVFERRQPALVDNPSHLLLGPMFVMAKLFIALGFRNDLAAIIGPETGRGPCSADRQHG
jgi:uncharacterized membrane protein YGL010W